MKHKSSAETDGTKVLDKVKLLEIMNVQDFIAIRLQSGAKQTLQSLSITVLAWLLKKGLFLVLLNLHSIQTAQQIDSIINAF